MSEVSGSGLHSLLFDIKVYDREAGFRKRGADPGNKERLAFIKRTGLSKEDLDELIVALNSKY